MSPNDTLILTNIFQVRTSKATLCYLKTKPDAKTALICKRYEICIFSSENWIFTQINKNASFLTLTTIK